MADKDRRNIEIEVIPPQSLAEFDAWVMLSILEQGGLNEGSWLWLSVKLEKLLDGIPPTQVFPNIGRESQKNKTTERDIRLVQDYVQLRSEGLKKAAIEERLASEYCISESVVQTAWKRWGKFFPES